MRQGNVMSEPLRRDWSAPDDLIDTGTLAALLDDAAERWSGRDCLEYEGRRTGFATLRDLSTRLAAGLVPFLAPGDAVALLLPNTPWHPVAFFALGRLGIRIVNLSPLDAPRELAHKLHDSGARVVITTDLFGLDARARALVGEGKLERVLVGEDAFWRGETTPEAGSASLTALLRGAAPAVFPTVAPDAVAVLQYTGGTTGLPKAAMLTHANLTAASNMYRAWSAREFPPRDEPGRCLAVLPLFHIYALTTILLRQLADGHEILLRARFDAGATLRDIAERRVTGFSAVPTMWIALLHHPDAATTDFSSLRHCVSGGAPLPFDVQRRVEAMVGVPLHNGWGMTETSPAGTRMPTGVEPRPGMIGRALPGIDMRVVSADDGARVLPPGEIGELAIRGPNVFAGYWNRPDATREAFRDGYFLTGDLGHVDADGLYTLVGRKKNMIISSGLNVYPAMLESAIHEHPDIVAAIVIGIDDAYRGQAAKAFVTLRPGAATLTLADLRAFLRDRLGPHEMPVALEIRDVLPRSAAGKLLGSVLEAEERARAEREARR